MLIKLYEDETCYKLLGNSSKQYWEEIWQHNEIVTRYEYCKWEEDGIWKYDRRFVEDWAIGQEDFPEQLENLLDKDCGGRQKIVVLNGSPRKDGNTEIMIREFAKIVSQDHKLKILPIANMDIHGCLGCKYCYSHAGACVQKDDMSNVLEELEDADMVVFASPIYWFDITAQMKTVIDRTYAVGGTGEGFHFHKTALLLDAGADHVFDAAIAQYKAMTSYLKWKDMGIIKVPNMAEKGSMRTAPELAQVIELAKNI